MFRIQTIDRISTRGLNLLPLERYEVASEFTDPDAILVRSSDIREMKLSPRLKAVARAGAGTNNVPVERCTERGIVVFNTPGANANSVKELVLTGLLLSSRQIYQGLTWVRSLVEQRDEIPSLVEQRKKHFAGPEIRGKRLGVIGLGSIGVSVANAAGALGMQVTGFDPFISVESAWGLSRDVQRAISLDSLLASSDYITIHVPLNDRTRGMIGRSGFSVMKRGVRLLNFARGGLVDNSDLLDAIHDGIVSWYVTDFPEENLVREERVLCLPHLGASTPEAEENCAVMAVEQIREFMENGNISNSVNFPECRMVSTGKHRIVIANRNIPAMMGQITSILAEEKINISDYLNQHKGEIAYNIVDVESEIEPRLLERLGGIEGIIMVRAITENGKGG